MTIIRAMLTATRVSKQDSSYPINDGSSHHQKMVCQNKSELVILKFIPYNVGDIHTVLFSEKAELECKNIVKKAQDETHSQTLPILGF